MDQIHSVRRRAQVVSTNAQRKRVIECMIERNSHPLFNGSLMAVTVDAFHRVFSQRNRRDNREKARH